MRFIDYFLPIYRFQKEDSRLFEKENISTRYDADEGKFCATRTNTPKDKLNYAKPKIFPALSKCIGFFLIGGLLIANGYKDIKKLENESEKRNIGLTAIVLSTPFLFAAGRNLHKYSFYKKAKETFEYEINFLHTNFYK